MKIRLTITALFLFFSCTVYGDQKVDLDSPEGWAMAFMTASAQNLGQVPPHSVDVGDISISAELSSIPRLTREQQRIGFGGFKDEDLNKSPAFGRLRANIGLPWNLNAEISWTPPLQINGSKPDHLWGAALSKPLVNNEKIDIGLRLFLLRGGVTASVTCSEDVINFAPYTLQNTVGCVGLSDDKLQMDHEGVEVFLSFNNASAILPWISLAASNIDNFVEIDAPLEVGRQRETIYSSGTIQTLSVGFDYEINENWSLNASSSYTPLDAQRPNDNSDNDDFWNVSVGLTIRY
jgi:hypothetical protein